MVFGGITLTDPERMRLRASIERSFCDAAIGTGILAISGLFAGATRSAFQRPAERFNGFLSGAGKNTGSQEGCRQQSGCAPEVT